MTQPNTPPLMTIDLLRDLGFTPSADRWELDLGGCRISAIEGVNRYFVPIIQISGIMATKREIAEIKGELSLELASRELGLALLAWIIDNATRNLLPDEPLWLLEGRSHQSLLPWVREQAAYNARPRCSVDRDWAKMALKKLSLAIETLSDEVTVVFKFDGQTMTIKCTDTMIPVPAVGQSWYNGFQLTVGHLRQLPKRLMNDPVEFSLWESALLIDARRYTGVTIQSGA